MHGLRRKEEKLPEFVSWKIRFVFELRFLSQINSWFLLDEKIKTFAWNKTGYAIFVAVQFPIIAHYFSLWSYREWDFPYFPRNCDTMWVNLILSAIKSAPPTSKDAHRRIERGLLSAFLIPCNTHTEERKTVLSARWQDQYWGGEESTADTRSPEWKREREKEREEREREC